jgi:Universal stress protein family
MIKNILVAYDGTDPADNAFEYARLIRGRFGASIDVISVIRRPLIGDDVELTAELRQDQTGRTGHSSTSTSCTREGSLYSLCNTCWRAGRENHCARRPYRCRLDRDRLSWGLDS